MFISGFFSQREGAIGRYARLLVTVHLRMPLMLNTVDTKPVSKASHAEWVEDEVKNVKNWKGYRNRGCESTIVIIGIGMFVVKSESGCEIIYEKFQKKTNLNYELNLHWCRNQTCDLCHGSEMKTGTKGTVARVRAPRHAPLPGSTFLGLKGLLFHW